MAVTAADLKQPKGPVTPAMFPGVASNVLDANLEAYIDTAASDARIASDADQTKSDQRIRALALHFVFNDAFIEMNARPLQISQTEKGAHGYSMEQVRNMRALADKYFEEFLGLLTPSTASARRGGTTAIPTSFTF